MKDTKKLRPYQEEGVAFLQENKAAGLFMDMGLGKTTTVLHALADLPGPTLLVGPLRVVESVWHREAADWEATRNLKCILVRGSPKYRQEARRTKADIYLVNPEILEECLSDPPPGGFRNLVIDESTMFKNPSTKRFKVLRRHLKDFERRMILTGLPTPNSIMDLWSQIFVLDRGERLDTSFMRFKSKYFYTTDYQGYKFEPFDWATEDILSNTRDILYRISGKDVLPPREVLLNKIYTPLPAAAQKQYDKMAEEAFLEIAEEETLTAGTAATKLVKLRQLAGGFIYNDQEGITKLHSAKLDALQEIIDSLNGEPVIIVYQFNHERDELMKRYPDAPKYSEEVQDAWDAGEIPIMFLHPQSGGHGINLQKGGCKMVVYSGTFSYEQMHQTMGRIDRSGQKNPVTFHLLVAPDTVDEMLLKVIEGKEKTQKAVLAMIKEYANEYQNSK